MTKVECRLARMLPDGTRVPCFEETEPGKGRSVLAVVSDRLLDRPDPPGPYEGLYLIPLDGEPTYGNDERFLDGPWHYISLSVYKGRVSVQEVKWPDDPKEREAAGFADIQGVELDWDFGDDDGVETVRVPYEGVVYVVPLRFIPDSREVPERPVIGRTSRAHTDAERRRNGLAVTT